MDRGKKDGPKTRVLPTGETKNILKRVVVRPEVDVYSERLLIPTALIAHAFDVTLDAVIKWGIRPVVKESQTALLYLPEVIAHRLGFGEDGAPKLNPAQEKALLDRTRRERAEIELSLERGEVVKVDDVCKELERELIIVRQKLLAAPSKLARTLSTIDKPNEIQDILTSAIVDALKGLNYGGRLHFENPANDKPNIKAAAEANPS